MVHEAALDLLLPLWTDRRMVHGRLLLCFLYPPGAPFDRGVYPIQHEQRRMHGSSFQTCKYQAGYYLHRLEGIREGEQGILRGILEKQRRERFGDRDKAKDTEHGFRFFQRTSLVLRRNQVTGQNHNWTKEQHRRIIVYGRHKWLHFISPTCRS
ncbi:hypothetical protein VNO77_17542 [Canavalia gladiata]|uniref:Uncharacterized protein n=1 Tax=Canavalia gladiata TaxID=3824 RepID=A0AAN9LJW6_CANGL